MSFSEIRDEIALKLKEIGWKSIDFSIRMKSSSGKVDILARTKGMRKKTLFIQIADNPFDAGIVGMLLDGLTEKGLKVLYLLDGNPTEAQVSSEISIINKISDLPSA